MTIKLNTPIIEMRIEIVRPAISKTEYVLLKSFIFSDDDNEASAEVLYVSFVVEFIVKFVLIVNVVVIGVVVVVVVVVVEVVVVVVVVLINFTIWKYNKNPGLLNHKSDRNVITAVADSL